ncbi:MAG: glycoside hydrolase family 2 protein [Solirubrobacteraceae bacterium]
MRSAIVKRSLIALAVVGVAPVSGAHAASQASAKVLYHDGADGRYLLDGTWLFRGGGANPAATSTAGWRPVGVPNAWNAGDNSVASFIGGIASYRRDFVLPPGPASAWIVRFESVNYRATVWLNGHLLGRHAGAHLPFELPLSALRRGINRLVIRVNSRHFDSDLPPSGLAASGVPIGGWWNYGGLLREVYLRRVKSVDLTAVAARPLLPCATCAASMSYSTLVTNYSSSPQQVRVVARLRGRPFVIGSALIRPGGQVRLTRTQSIGHAHLWSLNDPYLYPLVIEPTANGVAAEAYRLAVGVRSIRVTQGHLELNGQPLNLRGVGLMEDDPRSGAALDNAQRDREIGWVRALGAHLIRAHYPMDPYLLELADRYGILVWSEIPVYSLQSGVLARPSVRSFALGMLRDTIAANGNHPSVAVWSVANELTSTPGLPETTWFDDAARTAHAADPTRPVGAAINGYPRAGCQTTAYRHLDLLGLNDYFGWYPGPNGSIADLDLLGGFLDQARICYPGKALLVTELGAEANRDGPPEERGTYQFQQNFVRSSLGIFETKPYLSGVTYWTLQEYKVKPGWSGGNPYPNPPLGQKGLVTFAGLAKPAFGDARSEYRSTVQARPVGSPPNW